MLLLLLAFLALAAPPAESAPAAYTGVEPTPAPPDDGFAFLGLFQVRGNLSNAITTNAFLDGQVVGTLGGTNGTTVLEPGVTDLNGDGKPDDDVGLTRAAEQRLSAFFSYAPPVLDGRASLTAGFEVDFAYGDQSYATGGNTGGGFGGDQVNLQTRRLLFEARPDLGSRHSLKLVGGLQFVADGVYDPSASLPDDLFRAGGGLRFFGSEAAGLSAYGRVRDSFDDLLRYRLGAYTLVENGMALDDDVGLFMGDLQWHPLYRGRVGLHGWILRDRSGGSGGFFGCGPTSQLSELQGGPVLDLDDAEVDADLVWITVDGGLNHALDRGSLGLSAAVTLNAGRLYAEGASDVAVSGWLADAEARWRWAHGKGSVARAELLWTSSDDDDHGRYTGIITGNSYGVVGAVYASHGTILIFPDVAAINRQVSVVSDVSDGGDGLLGLTGSLGYDLVPNRLTMAVHGGHARDGAGEALGTEVGGRLTWEPWVFWRLSAVGATVLDAAPAGDPLPADPWAAYAYLEWVVF